MAKAVLKAGHRRPQDLASYFRAANIFDYPDWASEITFPNPVYEHQIGDLNHLAANVRSGLWSDPGTGKTLPMQAHAVWLVSQGNKAICTMPPVLVTQFQRSLHATFRGIEKYVTCAIYQGDLNERNALLQQWDKQGWPDLLLMSYDMFAGKSQVELEAVLQKQRKAAIKKGITTDIQPTPALLANVRTWLSKGYTHLVVDEATAVKRPSSDLHKAVKAFVGPDGPESNGLVLATGSPVENSIIDIFGLVKLITPERYRSYRSFEFQHCVMSSGKFPKVVDFINVDYAYESLYLKGRRITKRDALDLPPKIITELQIDLAPAHMELYKRLVRERVLEIGDKVIDATTASSLFVKSQRILLCPELFTDANWKVENTLLTTLDELLHTLSGHKVLVFAWFTESIKKLMARYTKLNPACLYGGVTGNERDVQKQKFLSDQSCKLLICNPKSGGVGVDLLQTVSSHMVFAEGVTTPGVWDQAVSRLHRSGQQGEAVNVYLLTALRTVAVKRRNDLLRKEEQSSRVVGDKHTLLQDLMGESGIQGVIQ